jgi:hypothetical protein
MFEETTRRLAIWERIRDKVDSAIGLLVERIRVHVAEDKSLAKFRSTIPRPRQFYEVLEERANSWISEVHRICQDARGEPNEPESTDFMHAIFDFVVEPFIDEQLHDLLLRAAGFKDIERQLAKRGERELMAYIPERPSLIATAGGCREVKEKIRSHWRQELCALETSIAPTDTSPPEESQRPQEFRLSSDGRSFNWNGEQIVVTPHQFPVLKILYENYESGRPIVSDEYILAELESTSKRLRDRFQGSPLWDTLIVSAGRAMHRLDPENGFPKYREKMRNAPNTR